MHVFCISGSVKNCDIQYCLNILTPLFPENGSNINNDKQNIAMVRSKLHFDYGN